jgi:hypothetical protein
MMAEEAPRGMGDWHLRIRSLTNLSWGERKSSSGADRVARPELLILTSRLTAWTRDQKEIIQRLWRVNQVMEPHL